MDRRAIFERITAYGCRKFLVVYNTTQNWKGERMSNAIGGAGERLDSPARDLGRPQLPRFENGALNRSSSVGRHRTLQHLRFYIAVQTSQPQRKTAKAANICGLVRVTVSTPPETAFSHSARFLILLYCRNFHSCFRRLVSPFEESPLCKQAMRTPRRWV